MSAGIRERFVPAKLVQEGQLVQSAPRIAHLWKAIGEGEVEPRRAVSSGLF
jgi:hypothetical protein